MQPTALPEAPSLALTDLCDAVEVITRAGIDLAGLGVTPTSTIGTDGLTVPAVRFMVAATDIISAQVLADDLGLERRAGSLWTWAGWIRPRNGVLPIECIVYLQLTAEFRDVLAGPDPTEDAS
ncbi:hypothetical protein GCM10027059_44620 [Myceligenerans halotolerans]